MRGLAILAALAALAPPLAAQESVHAGRATAAGSVSLRIHNLEGATRLSFWDRDSIDVRGTVETGGRRSGFYLAGDDAGRGFKLGVETTAEGRPVGAARLEVRVPRGSRVWVKSNGASIESDGAAGGLDLYSVSGRIRVTGRADQLSVESMDGDVEIAAAAGWLKVKTADGRVLLTGSADDAAVSSVSGAIVVEGGGWQRARFESVTGAIEFRGTIPAGAGWVFETHSGPVTIRPASGSDATVKVSTFGGDVRSDFAASGAAEAFRIGRGEGAVDVRTFRGAVAVRRP